MKVFVYMNERIRQRSPKGPVIVAQCADGSKVEGNFVVINGPSTVRFDPRGLPFAPEHSVKAWVEAELADVVVK